jgi:hypothetical protein
MIYKNPKNATRSILCTGSLTGWVAGKYVVVVFSYTEIYVETRSVKYEEGILPFRRILHIALLHWDPAPPRSSAVYYYIQRHPTLHCTTNLGYSDLLRRNIIRLSTNNLSVPGTILFVRL